MKARASIAYILILLQISMSAFSGMLKLPELGSVGQEPKSNETDDNSRENSLADSAVGLSQLIADKNLQQTATSYATSHLSQTATDEVRGWLEQYGTTQIQLGLDDSFGLRDSSADVLVPFFGRDKGDFLTFAQVGLRRYEHRTTGNIGLGTRYFDTNWMYGANTFFDNDFTGSNRRFGIGAELWHDNFKLNANGYFRITNWHTSEVLDDYDERPANGFDIIARAYLPKYPQLGAKVAYEQYYGKEVALFGRDDREKNPSAMTLGLSYTPVPLLTLIADFRNSQKEAKNDEAIIGLQFNYDFNVPISQQLNPESVAITRSLAGSRLELVERNNNIVMDYKKKELINVQLGDSYQGEELTKIPITFAVKSKYGISSINWGGTILAQKGVSITPVSSSSASWILALPKYVAETRNEYTLSVSVKDEKGNEANSIPASVIVTPAKNSLVKGSLVCVPSKVVAAPSANTECQVLVKNNQGKEIQGVKISWVSSSGVLSEKSSITNSEGIARTKISNDEPANITLTATLDGNSLSTNVEFVAGEIDINHSSLKLAPQKIVADGNTFSLATFKAADAQGNPLDNLTVSLISSGVPVTLGTMTKSGHAGEYQGRVTSGTVSGDVNITVSTNGLVLTPLTQPLTLLSGELSVEKSTLTANPLKIQADGSSVSYVTLNAKDEYGNAVTQGKFSLKKATSIPFNISSLAPTGTSGEYVSVLTAGNQQGLAKVSLIKDSMEISRINTSVELMPGDISATKSLFTITPSTIQADGHSTSKLIFEAKDKNENILPNLRVAFLNTTDGVPVTIGNVSELENGHYEATVTSGNIAGIANIVPSVAGATIGTPKPLELTYGDISSTQSSLLAIPSEIKADNQSTSKITFTARDSANNLITDAVVSIFSSGTDAKIAQTKNNHDGTYTAILTAGKQAGTVQLSVNVDGNLLADVTTVVKLIPGAIDPSHSQLTVKPREISADGVSTAKVTLEAKDAVGNVVANQKEVIVFNIDGLLTELPKVGPTTEVSPGIYEATITAGHSIGQVSVSVKNLNGLSQPLTLRGGAPDMGKSQLIVSKESVRADPTENPILITLSLFDTDGHAAYIEDESLYGLINTGVDAKIYDIKYVGDGKYTGLLVPGLNKGKVTINPTKNGSAITSISKDIELIQRFNILSVQVDQHSAVWEVSEPIHFPTTGLNNGSSQFSLNFSKPLVSPTYSSSNQSVARVTKNGRVTIVGRGATKINVDDGLGGDAGKDSYDFNIKALFTPSVGLASITNMASNVCTKIGLTLVAANDYEFKGKGIGGNGPEVNAIGHLLGEWFYTDSFHDSLELRSAPKPTVMLRPTPGNGAIYAAFHPDGKGRIAESMVNGAQPGGDDVMCKL